MDTNGFFCTFANVMMAGESCSHGRIIKKRLLFIRQVL